MLTRHERHVRLIGKAVPAEGTLLFNLAMSDVIAGDGVAIIDPHGNLATDILDAIARSRINDACCLDTGETEYRLALARNQHRTRAARARRRRYWLPARAYLERQLGIRLKHFLIHGVAAVTSAANCSDRS